MTTQTTAIGSGILTGYRPGVAWVWPMPLSPHRGGIDFSDIRGFHAMMLAAIWSGRWPMSCETLAAGDAVDWRPESAWRAVDEMKRRGLWLNLTYVSEDDAWVANFFNATMQHGGIGDTAPEAIRRAALAALRSTPAPAHATAETPAGSA